jgi:hypothetical protein
LLANFLNRKNRLEAYNMGNKLYNFSRLASPSSSRTRPLTPTLPIGMRTEGTGMVLPIQKGNETVQIIDMLEGYEARGRQF